MKGKNNSPVYTEQDLELFDSFLSSERSNGNKFVRLTGDSYFYFEELGDTDTYVLKKEFLNDPEVKSVISRALAHKKSVEKLVEKEVDLTDDDIIAYERYSKDHKNNILNSFTKYDDERFPTYILNKDSKHSVADLKSAVLSGHELIIKDDIALLKHELYSGISDGSKKGNAQDKALREFKKSLYDISAKVDKPHVTRKERVKCLKQATADLHNAITKLQDELVETSGLPNELSKFMKIVHTVDAHLGGALSFLLRCFNIEIKSMEYKKIADTNNRLDNFKIESVSAMNEHETNNNNLMSMHKPKKR